VTGHGKRSDTKTTKATKITTSYVFVFLVIFVVFVSAPWAISSAQQGQQPTPGRNQRPVFRVGAHYVSVDAYPTNRDGKIVEGLTKDDFSVYEDDRPQTIERFEFISSEYRPPDDERPAYLSPREGLELAADPRYRVFVIVIDRSALSRESWLAVRDVLRGYLRTEVAPRDLIGLITADDEWQTLVLGRRLAAIEQQIDDPEFLRRKPSEDSLVLTGCGLEGLERRARADATYVLLEGIVRLLGQVREDHTSLVFVSNGLTRQGRDDRAGDRRPLSLPPRVGIVNGRIQRVPGAGDMNLQYCKSEQQRLSEMNFDRRFSDLVAAARSANVSFYPVAVPFDFAPMSQAGRGRAAGAGPYSAERGSLRPMPMLPRAVERPSESLVPLAKDTFGFAMSAKTDLAGGLHRMADHVGAHYLLGYYTTNTKWDGKLRRITVRIKPRGEQIAARREYRAPTREEIEGLAARREGARAIRPPAVAEALGVLSRLRPSAQFFSYGAVAGTQMTVTIEVPADAVEAGRWSQGGLIEVLADAADGESVGMARGRLAPNGRATVQVPLDGARAPSSLLVRLRVDGEALTERVSLSSAPRALVGDPFVSRSGPRGLAIPVASFLFSRDERVKLDWPALGDVDKYDARLLDTFGQPLRLPIAVQEYGDAPNRHLMAEIALAPLNRGDYVVELTAASGQAIEQRLTAFRVR